MANVIGPLLSLGARKSVGGALTFANWKGLNTVRIKSSPSNPKTTSQMAGRAYFAAGGFRPVASSALAQLWPRPRLRRGQDFRRAAGVPVVARAIDPTFRAVVGRLLRHAPSTGHADAIALRFRPGDQDVVRPGTRCSPDVRHIARAVGQRMPVVQRFGSALSG